jgi:hypothetical protein
MTVTVTHTTPADSSFSTAGAAAWNADHTLTGVGTMAEQNANAVAITGGAVDGATVGATTAAAGTFTTLKITGVGNNFTGDFSNATVASRNAFKTSTTNGSTGIYALPNGTSTAASWQATNAADPTNASKILIATNGSTDVQLVSGINGSGSYLPLAFYNGGAKQVEVGSVPSAVNYQSLVGSVTTKTPVYSVAGTDTNIALALQSKGTGAIDLAAGSSGVNISNGGTVTAITTTASGASYTSAPSVTISAPTTAGGVQATAQVYVQATGTYTVANGGSGYTVGDTLTFSGGTGSINATATVSTVSAGVITAISFTSGGAYTVVPTNPVSVTGGTGSGATFNLTAYQARIGAPTWSITNAGSGYVEQPTVSFSGGGGGSGAAAYATVGSGAVVRSLGTSLSFYTPSGNALTVSDNGNTTINYLQVTGGQTGSRVLLKAQGGDSNVDLTFLSSGTGAINFSTNGSSGNAQFKVTNTASAVNYVQVTGSITSGGPIVSAQGSDANAELKIRSKGIYNVLVQNGAGNNGLVVDFTSGATTANYFQMYAKVAGSSPSLAVLGTDTNIDLTLTPKGTGVVQFGTYTATVTAVAGYIQIKDAGGTLRKLAVLT